MGDLGELVFVLHVELVVGQAVYGGDEAHYMRR